MDRTKPRARAREERGVALVMAMLMLLVMALLAAVLMMSISINRKIAGHDLRMSKALNSAEAGVGEALARIRSGDVALPTTNPRSVGQIFLCAAGSVPVMGPDTIPVETRQPAGQWLPYSAATRGPDVLTVEFKTDPARTVIYRYDNTKTPPINLATGLPVYVISATGRQGAAVKRVVTEVIQKPFNVNCKAALAADHDVRFIGNAVVCGYNHRYETPPWDGEDGRTDPLVDPTSCVDNETGSGDLPGSWTTGSTWNGGTAYQAGNPPNLSNQTGFYTGPWDVLSLPQADFFAWIGTPLTAVPANLNAIVYLDNDAIAQNQSGGWGIHGATGEGLLYVDGDLTLNATFVYKGLVYIEGDLLLNGDAWILGGLIVRGQADVTMTGGATILYSSDAIQQALAKFGGQFVTLSWREK